MKTDTSQDTPCRPWLADDAQITLPKKLAKEALSHRRWPGEAVPGAVVSNRLNSFAHGLNQRYKKSISFDYGDCSPEWQQAIAEALSLIDTEVNTALSPQVLAVLVALKNDSNPQGTQDLQDHIVEQGGLEYATEVVIALQFIHPVYDYGTDRVNFLPANQPPNYLRSYSVFEWRLRKHLSLADDALWQRCADKLAAALPSMPAWRQPLVSLLLPEKPDIARDTAARLHGQPTLCMLEWLKLTATDAPTLAILDNYPHLDIFNDYYIGKTCCATLLQEQGLPALARLAPYAYGDICGEVLTHINHPQALGLLIDASGQSKRAFERMTKASERFPHAMLAALAERLAQKDDPCRLTQLLALLNAQPEIVTLMTPWLSARAQAVVEHGLQQLNQQTDSASSDQLPAILVSPPWTEKKKKAVVPVLALAPLALDPVCSLSVEKREDLLKKEGGPQTASEDSPTDFLSTLGFRRWDGFSVKNVIDSALDAWQREDYPALIEAFKTFHHPYQGEWNIFRLLKLPPEKALRIWNYLSQEPHYGARRVMLHLGLAGLPGFIHSLSRYPQTNLPVALWFGASELAPIIARAFSKLKSVRGEARQWLLAYPEHAITGLLPAAFGRAGEARECARQALQLLADNGHLPLLEQIAGRYQQPEVMDALAALLALDPLDNHPSKIPSLPGFWLPALWARPRLRENDLPLSDDALKHLGAMLRFPQDEGLYPGLLQVKAACTPTSLAAFAWDLYLAWQAAGAPPKESWAFSALGVFGDDDTARKLTPLIRAWPGQSQHKRATAGLDILAAIGSDIALMQLNGIAQKLKFKALQTRAREKIQHIANSHQLTVAELEDRLAPDLGLDEQGSLTLDFGTRRFSVSFDEALKPFVCDENGSRLKDLPKPNKNDDAALSAEAVGRYKALKKDARTVAAQQIARLESAMCQRRRWTVENFRLFLVEHPLVRHLTRRLVWGVYGEDNTLQACFRVAEDNSYSNADDELFTLPGAGIAIGLPHALEIDAAGAAAFGQLFADYQLLAPFRQLDRHVWTLSDAELAATSLSRWAGRKTPGGRVAGLANKGWLRGQPLDGGWIGWMLKPLGPWTLVVELDEGFYVGSTPEEYAAEQQLKEIWLWQGEASDFGWGTQTPQKKPFSVLDRVALSEAVNDIQALFD
ncbi:DUF4132 domain-containing protein [Klebsiella aerogenes]|uniref:DUF4132 domain-containing protein n=1 Tax=Klebsiella aerogenes TaxID=548 RepID=UPI002DB58254|nr:DUF4132 domain-containing protein [Klebsiella aerogenes]MEB5696022.1 DUF4132 domain-containing protein [Klebsiella aerogenes]